MTKYFFRLLVLGFLAVFVVSCATQPPQLNPTSVANAKRFLHSFGAGQLAMDGFNNALKSEPKGYVELAHRAFADVTPADFENVAAKVYARNLSEHTLAVLANFSVTSTGKRFFNYSIKVARKHEGRKYFAREIGRMFNADELTQIVKFAKSDAYKEWKQKIPKINREMREAGRKLGKAKINEYIKTH